MTSTQVTNGTAVLDAGLIGSNYTTRCVRQTGSVLFEFESH